MLSPESECGWVLWTRGSVLSSVPSLRGQSPRFLRSCHPPVARLFGSTALPAAGSATCCWVRTLSPDPQRRQEIVSTCTQCREIRWEWEGGRERDNEVVKGKQENEQQNRKTCRWMYTLPAPTQALPALRTHTTSTFPDPEVDSWMAFHLTALSQSTQTKAQVRVKETHINAMTVTYISKSGLTLRGDSSASPYIPYL